MISSCCGVITSSSISLVGAIRLEAKLCWNTGRGMLHSWKLNKRFQIYFNDNARLNFNDDAALMQSTYTALPEHVDYENKSVEESEKVGESGFDNLLLSPGNVKYIKTQTRCEYSLIVNLIKLWNYLFLQANRTKK